MLPDPEDRQPTLIDVARADTARLARPPAGGDGTVADRYALRSLIGTGGMCTVWRAVDTTLDREVAVKLLHTHLAGDEEARSRFASEARRAAKVDHPRVVRVLDAGTDRRDDGVDDVWMVMELVDGPSLADRLREGPLAPEAARRVGVDVADALAAAHRLDVVHRDVKPGNVLLAGDGARLGDFGIARSLGDARATATGQLVGTAAYLSPEQATGAPAGPASDVYALGCVLFEAITGRRRFDGEGPLQVALARVGTQTAPSDLGPDVPPPLAAAVVALLAPAAADRPADGAAAAALLRAAAGTSSAASSSAASSSAGGAHAAVTSADGGADGAISRPADADTSHPTDRTDTPVATATRGTPDRRRQVVAGVIAAGLLGLALLGLALARGPAADGTAADGGVAQGDPSGTAPVGYTPTSFDPQGGGGEHEDEVGLLIDGDPATPWTTERYTTAAFGNLKDGVGVALDLGGAVDVAEVRLFGMAAGQTVQLRTADGAPAALDQTTVVAEAADAGTEVALAPPAPVTATHLVIWLTGTLPGGGGGFRGQLGEVQVIPAG